MGKTTGWQRNNCRELRGKEQEEDGCNVVAFSSKRVSKHEKHEELKKVADNLLLYTCLIWKLADNVDGTVQSIF